MLLEQAQFKPTELYLNSIHGLNFSKDIRIIKTLVDGFEQSLKSNGFNKAIGTSYIGHSMIEILSVSWKKIILCSNLVAS